MNKNSISNSNAKDVVELLAPFEERLRRIVASRCQDRTQVDDILQEVALAVVRSNSRPSTDAEKGAWLCRIALRQCALAVRQSARNHQKLKRMANRKLESPCMYDALYWMIAGERTMLLRKALGLLDSNQRQILKWKYESCLTYSEIASRLGVSRDKAIYEVVKSRKSLRQIAVQLSLDIED